MILTRVGAKEDGIFGNLTNLNRSLIRYVTLEHAYPESDGTFISKVPEGEYLCVKGWHQLKGMKDKFLTFEVTGVPGHSGILFHVGNYQKDSEGCILLGENYYPSLLHIPAMITNSKRAFQDFSRELATTDQFELKIVNQYLNPSRG